jgi:hypothetical protein
MDLKRFLIENKAVFTISPIRNESGRLTNAEMQVKFNQRDLLDMINIRAGFMCNEMVALEGNSLPITFQKCVITSIEIKTLPAHYAFIKFDCIDIITITPQKQVNDISRGYSKRTKRA